VKNNKPKISCGVRKAMETHAEKMLRINNSLAILLAWLTCWVIFFFIELKLRKTSCRNKKGLTNKASPFL
jgi:hypothetical protein